MSVGNSAWLYPVKSPSSLCQQSSPALVKQFGLRDIDLYQLYLADPWTTCGVILGIMSNNGEDRTELCDNI